MSLPFLYEAIFQSKDVIYISSANHQKQKILIVDDSEMNRSILADMLGDEYDIFEADDGVKAIAALQKHRAEIDLVLLDIVMPEMDGFEVLTIMNSNNWIEDLPVIMISAENDPSNIERAYNLGVADFINRPFNAAIVHRRVINTLLLYTKQKKLVGMVAEQIYEKEQHSRLMIDILSHIVEFRNGESGQHVLHIRTLTELLLKHLTLKTDRYNISSSDIALISTASALHDIGKIAIPEEILNKPGRFTPEEFEVMKTHSEIGANMMDGLPIHKDEPLVKVARSICRWHHERYDGKGYPDGLKGDEIPISAQIVALADVYDALTSERVYKKAYPHDVAVKMILDGQCGAFNPLLLECLKDAADRLPQVLQDDNSQDSQTIAVHSVAEEMHRHEELSASERTLQLLEHERMKYSFFATISQEIQFEYVLNPSMIILNAWGANRLGLKESFMNPLEDEKVLSIMGKGNIDKLSSFLRNTTPSQPVIEEDFLCNMDGESRWFRIIAKATWASDDPPQYTGAIGKAIDIHESRMKLDILEKMASHDPLTGLLNHASAKKWIQERMDAHPNEKFALAILDLDHFKSANDNYGHIFGDHVLKFLSSKLCDSIRGRDIVARVGGDEFLIFLEYTGDLNPIISRIFSSLSGCVYENFPISISMGIAETSKIGTNYEDLFHAADQALYTVKRSGRGKFRFYDESMHKMLSVISPIDSGESTPDNSEKGDDSK